MRSLGNYIACFYQALNGLKTYIVAGALLVLGLAEYFSLTDLRPLFELYLGTDKASLLCIVIPIVFGALRMVTDGKAKGRKRDDEDEGF